MFLRVTLIAAAAIATAVIGSASPANSEPRCYDNSSGTCVEDPTAAPTPPPGATALCRDGDYSFSEHCSGTCSGHHGVREWLVPGC
jgi:hypothetical protein